ncbi:UDP-N-acetylmuramoylalanine--D-glutamate ligase [Aerococcus urinaehominis]|uniref:UDP-N-acetylmuramoylalanine--D-glutamate ligase n=1 Tax=Aerococcus urinaehominis TaxID=128944 RepID=A0A0X8FLT5_9LACT|nr:UDP-N-acetylmuramoyl-L-alanine--D-glutamate ligase [Aerococcus urinaehominis]AMB99660.1 UDP-N-acetylmuramoylalanine--D-glutamate ligase [Aerococcus urinaehominis]SDL89325.1 UDP-N-acetylmuramoylalanine--D-glutamate ligase [Aerococcus urinaehominis]
MKKQAISNLAQEKILVLGLAVTGMSVVKCLNQQGIKLTINDITPIDENEAAQMAKAAGNRVITGDHPVEILADGYTLLVKNPGIPYSNPMVVEALRLGIPVVTDVELAGRLSQAPLIAITGSNGKTTTTTMTSQILRAADQPGHKSFVGGNIGIPLLEVVTQAGDGDRIVCELSSFQLKGTQEFKPHIAAITNIFPAHLDYHGSIEDYINSKWQITSNQTAEDYLIVNADQDDLVQLLPTSQAQIIPFSRKIKLDQGAYYDEANQGFYFNSELVMTKADLALPGGHNIENALVAIAIAKLLDIDNVIIKTVLSQFHGVAHRLQFVDQINQRLFYNDSKATNNEATITALSSFNQDLIWLAGGLDRGSKLDVLLPYLDHVQTMVVFGENQADFIALASQAGINQVIQARDVAQAVGLAYQISQAGDAILLSPASASWDQYPNFEVRGQVFIDAVNQLKEEIES